jgi:hypothetical protein
MRPQWLQRERLSFHGLWGNHAEFARSPDDGGARALDNGGERIRARGPSTAEEKTYPERYTEQVFKGKTELDVRDSTSDWGPYLPPMAK